MARPPERLIRAELDGIADMIRGGTIDNGAERLQAALDRYRRAAGDAWPLLARVVIQRHPVIELVGKASLDWAL